MKSDWIGLDLLQRKLTKKKKTNKQKVSNSRKFNNRMKLVRFNPIQRKFKNWPKRTEFRTSGRVNGRMHCGCVFHPDVVGEIAFVVVDVLIVLIVVFISDAVLPSAPTSFDWPVPALSPASSGVIGVAATSAAGSVFWIVVLLNAFVLRPSILKPNFDLKIDFDE